MMNDKNLKHVGTLSALAAAALSTLVLGGCMSFIPAYERPAAPVAPAYAAELLPAGAAGTAAATDIEWQRFFTDARLRRLIEISLANNRDLRVAVLNIEAARAAYQVKRADELPSVGAGFTAQRAAGATGGLVNTYAVGLQVTGYELDFFGRVRSLSQAALSQYLATEESRKTVQIALVSSVANAYVALLSDDELLRVTRETLKTRDESFKLTKLKFDNGAASELDFRQAEQLLEGARATLAQTQRQRALDENALVLLLGQALPADLPAGLTLASQQVVAGDLPAGLPSDLLTRRPDVRAAEQQLLAANANIGAARAQFFPSLTLTADGGLASVALSALFTGPAAVFTLAPALALPLFRGGANQANLDLSKVQKELLIASYELAIQTAFREVADALATRSTITDQLTAQSSLVNAATKGLELARARYEGGVEPFLSTLVSERALYAAKSSLVATQVQALGSRVTLYRVLGGGLK